MKRFILITAIFTLATLASACGTNVNNGNPPDYGEPSATQTPVPGAYLDLTLEGVSFDDHNGQTVMARIINGPNVIACQADIPVQNGTFSVIFDDVLMEDTGYVVEIVAQSVDGDAKYNSGVDRTFMIELLPEDVTTDVVRSYDATAGEHGIGWPINTACPS